MSTPRSSLLLFSSTLLLAAGCPDPVTSDGDSAAGSSSSASSGEGPGTTSSAGSASGTTRGESDSTTSGDPETSGGQDGSSGSAGSSTSGAGTTRGSTTDDGTTSGGMTSSSTGSESGETSGGLVCPDPKSEDFDFTYIWVANSPEGTVSKIDTQSAVELGRYRTGPAGSDPSRTSVSSDGRYAAIADRAGRITVIAANEEQCVDTSGNGMIETSSGPGDVLAWESDECVIWSEAITAMSGSQGPRPISWTIGMQDPISCEFDAGDIWIGWYELGTNTGHFLRKDGLSGMTLAEVDVPNWSGESWGPYGGAIDSNNDFWVTGWGQNGPVVRIDGDTNTATHFGNPGGWIYGMGLDLEGNTYATGCGVADVYRFEAATETWSTVASIGNASCLRGMQVDANGVAWIAKNGACGLAAIDTSVEPPVVIDDSIPLPGCSSPVGVSVDAEGFVWVVDQGASTAFKVDPMTYTVVDEVSGLVSPYTYSDMTGAGLVNQIVLPS